MAEFEKKPHKKYNPLTDMFNIQSCPICGKDFIVHDSRAWVYKRQDGKRHLYFCSYSCTNRYLKSKGKI